MAKLKCPDCPHPLDGHTRYGGCQHTRRHPSGHLIFCGCTRVPVDKT